MVNLNLTAVLNIMSEEYVYGKGRCDFPKLYKAIEETIDFNTLTVEDVKFLGFKKWDEEEYPNLWLFPIWLFPIIPEGIEVTSISGEKFNFEKEKADKDIRFGCLAYGLEIKEDNKNGEKEENKES